MVSVLASSVVDCGFIGGVMVSMLVSNMVDRITPPMNPRFTVFGENTLTITPPMNPRFTVFRGEHANHYTTDETTVIPV
jgi:hypothetical protein